MPKNPTNQPTNQLSYYEGCPKSKAQKFIYHDHYYGNKIVCICYQHWVEHSPMVRETGVQSQVESYQRLKIWYLMPLRLTLNFIRSGSRVKWSNPGNGVAPSPTLWCSSYCKGSLRVALDWGRQLYFPYQHYYTTFSLFQYWCTRLFGIRA